MDLKVLYEDNHILAIDKAAGMLTQGDHTGRKSLLDEAKEYIRIKYGKPGNVFLGPVHRLDRDVSGIVLFARTSKAAKRLHQQFLTREVKKYYLAIVSGKGRLSSDMQQWIELVHHLRKQRGFTEVLESESGNSREGRLNVIQVAERGRYRLLVVRLITGRKHQIRAQLSSVGLPIEGDLKYGSKGEFPQGRICLHAITLSLKHPVKDESLFISSGIPEIFQTLGFGEDKITGMISELISEDIRRENRLT